MKVGILAIDLGTYLFEETTIKPKPMLWHIISTYAAHGFKKFVVALGYKDETIKVYW